MSILITIWIMLGIFLAAIARYFEGNKIEVIILLLVIFAWPFFVLWYILNSKV